jgi:hypothetical protein
MYFNTTQKKGFQKLIADERTNAIKDRVKIFFKVFGADPTHPGLTCSQVHTLHKSEFGSKSPIWSVRARVSELAKDGFIYRTSKKRIGPEGDTEFYYKLARL